ncbi:sensor histidine kinase [Xylocopilactobacillus apicola]|uniref:sensor histidine kinase n=1 Tax=Xylocopilactobacillus apicola TaxID=2932184 RepID=UPI0029546E15|nr:GHKL domain-containing protein [Xylocopilactobacillus apicola]
MLLEYFLNFFELILFEDFLRQDFKLRHLFWVILNTLVSVVLGYFSVLIWFFAPIIYRKIKNKKMDYLYFNQRLLALLITFTLNFLLNIVYPLMMKFIKNLDFSILFFELLTIISLMMIAILIHKKRAALDQIVSEIQKLNLERRVYWLLLISFLVIWTSYMAISAYLYFVPKETTTMVFISILLGVASVQLMAFLFLDMSRRAAEDKAIQNEQLQNYLNNIEQQYQELRHFKHDYHNLLLSLNSVVENDEQLNSYYQQLILEQPDEHKFSFALNHLDYLQNEPIRGLIVQKFFAAQKLGIELELEIKEPLVVPAKLVLTVIRILGILLDNAIEHVDKETDKKVSCALIKSPDLIEITVSNQASNLSNLDQLFENGFTTKKNHQGFGLANVRNLVDQNSDLFFEKELINGNLQMTLMIERSSDVNS